MQQVWDDVNLVWQNCQLYNGPDSELAKEAGEVDAAFVLKWISLHLPVPHATPKQQVCLCFYAEVPRTNTVQCIANRLTN